MVILIFILLLSGCSHGYSDDLIAVEQVMESDPERALQMLDNMPADKWRSGDDRALYGLLDTELRIKNRLPVESDSLIGEAIRHFWRNDDKKHLADGYIYKGRLEFNGSNYHDAMESLVTAVELSESISDILRMARSHEFMADVYRYVIDSEKALRHRRLASELYKKCGKRLNYYYALVETSFEYTSLGDYDKAVELLDSAEFMIKDSICTPWLEEYRLQSYILPLFYLKKYNAVKDKVKEAQALELDNLSINHYNALSIIYSREAKIDSAMMCIAFCEDKCVDLIDSIALVEAKMELARETKDYDALLGQTKQLELLQAKAVRGILAERVDEVQTDYFKKQNRISHLKERKTRVVAILISLFSLLILSISYLIFRNRLYKKHIIMDKKFAEMHDLIRRIRGVERQKEELSILVSEGNSKTETLAKTIKEKSSEINRMSEMVERLFKKQFMVLNKLCDEYFEKHDSDKMRVALYSELERVVLEMKSQDSLRELVNGVNECKGGVIDKLHNELPWLSENDITFIALIYADFSPRAVCLFMGFKLSNFYAKRKRLTAKIEASDAPSKDLFLSIMG